MCECVCEGGGGGGDLDYTRHAQLLESCHKYGLRGTRFERLPGLYVSFGCQGKINLCNGTSVTEESVFTGHCTPQKDRATGPKRLHVMRLQSVVSP